jgi:hypothetical protein
MVPVGAGGMSFKGKGVIKAGLGWVIRVQLAPEGMMVPLFLFFDRSEQTRGDMVDIRLCKV